LQLSQSGAGKQFRFEYLETCGRIPAGKYNFQIINVEQRQLQPRDLSAISFDIKTQHNFQPRAFRAHPPQIMKHRFIACGNRAQQTSPRKVDVNLVGYFIEFGRKCFKGGLHEEHVGQTALRRFAMDALGDFLQGLTVGVDADEQPVRISARRTSDEETVAGPNIDRDSSRIRSNQLLESSPVDLSVGFTAD
jgi:hypothetical protein